jgi:putative glutamine amidotransferase
VAARMKDPPLIGISSSELRAPADVKQTLQGEPPHRELALGLSYLHAIERAGGLPVILSPLDRDNAEPLVTRLAGVCLSGGPDLHPASYAADAHGELGPTEPEVDDFELALARAADARRLPLLGICRGAQTLNVARGGTLQQHLPDRTRLEHRQREPSGVVTHELEIAPDSLLADSMKRSSASVNSFHHQAVDELGRGLFAVAWAPDRTVEAIEARGRSFVLGVQWHAECLVGRPEQDALFEAFVEAARRRGRRAELMAA